MMVLIDLYRIATPVGVAFLYLRVVLIAGEY